MRIKNGGVYRDIDERYFQQFRNKGWEKVEEIKQKKEEPKKEKPKKEEPKIELEEDILSDIEEAPKPKTKKKRIV